MIKYNKKNLIYKNNLSEKFKISFESIIKSRQVISSTRGRLN